ncbi:MAG: DUF4833 domain-containing protein [Flavobacteriales bacterium]|nr:DUF4833 domain-containing protein [Flavobacteriales bacterium]
MRWLHVLLTAAAVVIGNWVQAQPAPPPHGSVFATFPAPPASKDLLFYIQRNKNANTIVYEANRDATGKLVSDDPVKVNWIRHTEGGIREPLNLMERTIAYGVSHRHTKDGMATMKFVASEKYPFIVQVRPGGQAEAWISLNGRMARLHHVYVQAVEGSWRPKVAYVDLYCTDVLTGKPVTEHYIP